MASTLLDRAIQLAVRAHEGQTRKDEPVPYVTHPIGVALLLARHGFSENAIAAALVHDVVEDTKVTPEELAQELGSEVAALVASVTNDDSLSWEEKKKKYIETVRAGSDEAKAVATADKIHNAQSLLDAYAREGSAIWSKFNAGRDKKLWFENAMLTMLKETWQHPLVDEYEVCVQKLEALV